MTGQRLDTGGLIDRTKPLNFTFDGKSYQGFKGDTLASALLANGVRYFGRSFKYHRPRGVWGAWFDDPNAIFNVRTQAGEFPNCLATTTQLVEGMHARAVNAWPNAQYDAKSVFGLFHKFLGAGFYYKTFMWPDWHLFEPSIRKAAGLGHVSEEVLEKFIAEQRHDDCDVLVVGGGAAGLAAARVAAEAGRKVFLVDDHPECGGGLYRRGGSVEGKSPAEWVADQTTAIIAAGGRILTSTTAYGAYDHKLYGLIEDRGFGVGPRLWRLRAAQVILAAGVTDRPMTFANNDMPGVMSIEGATEYLMRYGVRVGKTVALVSNNSFGDVAQARLEAAGATVRRLDPTQAPIKAKGWKSLQSVEQNGASHAADILAVSSGWTPSVHLWRHAGGKLDWSEDHVAFLPGTAPDGMVAVGAVNGTYDMETALTEARAVAAGKTVERGAPSASFTPIWPKPGSKGRQWIDFQHDVTLKDIELAARENFVSVEHLKRYTTLGMAADQGKTSNMTGLAAMAAIQGKSIPETGTTTFRPPFVPVPLEIYHGHRRGQSFSPLKRLALENRHRAAGAALGDYGGWLRPGWYGAKKPEDAVLDEVHAARNSLSVLDASPLGKIELMGPDAEAFVNFMYYNTIKTLKPGFIRYGFMLTEGGVVFDDGVVSRLGKNRFVISCSSSHFEGVYMNLEGWRQDGNDPDRIFVHETTTQWSTVTLAGPKSRKAMEQLGFDIDLSADAFKHMSFRETVWHGTPIRIARVSFTGDVSFEMSIASSKVGELWDAAIAIAEPLGGKPLGVEALSVLRAEKGYLVIGKDTDGETMPHDLGFSIPRQKKSVAFVGDRALHSDVANEEDRRQLVGLEVCASEPKLPDGAHIISEDAKPVSLGFVTSTYDSPSTGRPIAMALVKGGSQMLGETVTLQHFGEKRTAKVVSPCAFDPDGGRLHA